MNARSLMLLAKAHPDLRRLMIEAAKECPVELEISEVMRTLARQASLVKAGASKTMTSRHLTGHAADFYVNVNGKLRWDWPLYVIAATHIKKVATAFDIRIVWGGDWKGFRDGPHVELDRKVYPSLNFARGKTWA